MARIFCAVLSTIAAPPIIALLLGTALLAACAGDDRPRPMHIAAEVEGEAVKVEVHDIQTGRKITGLALVDATGHPTPARERDNGTPEESGGGNAGPGVGRGARGGSSQSAAGGCGKGGGRTGRERGRGC